MNNILNLFSSLSLLMTEMENTSLHLKFLFYFSAFIPKLVFCQSSASPLSFFKPYLQAHKLLKNSLGSNFLLPTKIAGEITDLHSPDVLFILCPHERERGVLPTVDPDGCQRLSVFTRRSPRGEHVWASIPAINTDVETFSAKGEKKKKNEDS